MADARASNKHASTSTPVWAAPPRPTREEQQASTTSLTTLTSPSCSALHLPSAPKHLCHVNVRPTQQPRFALVGKRQTSSQLSWPSQPFHTNGATTNLTRAPLTKLATKPNDLSTLPRASLAAKRLPQPANTRADAFKAATESGHMPTRQATTCHFQTTQPHEPVTLQLQQEPQGCELRGDASRPRRRHLQSQSPQKLATKQIHR